MSWQFDQCTSALSELVGERREARREGQRANYHGHSVVAVDQAVDQAVEVPTKLEMGRNILIR